MALFRKKREVGEEERQPSTKRNSGATVDQHAEFRELFYADQPLRQWAAVDDGFRIAADHLDAGDAAAATQLLRPIADDTRRESRVRLDAWHALRTLGVHPPESDAATVLGVVLAVPMSGGQDTLAVYADGRARYINYAGGVTVLEPATGEAEAIVAELIARAQRVASAIGPWDGPRPPLPPDACRVSMLCPGGLHFGQGQLEALAADSLAGPVLASGAQLVGALPMPDKTS